MLHLSKPCVGRFNVSQLENGYLYDTISIDLRSICRLLFVVQMVCGNAEGEFGRDSLDATIGEALSEQPLKPRSQEEFLCFFKRVNNCTRFVIAVFLMITLVPVVVIAIILLIIGFVISLLFVTFYAIMLLFTCCKAYHHDDIKTACFPFLSGPYLIGLWTRHLR